MIKSVTIQNFQSHKSTTLEFSKGVNVIVGLSDAGKSAIFHAINWIITNRPLGDAFRSDWGGRTRVELVLDPDGKVVREKDKNKNQYLIYPAQDDTPLVLERFGTEPPGEVNIFINMDYINIQNQADPPFLLMSSPGEVAQMLNRAASIDDIDRVTSSLRNTHRQLQQAVQSDQEKLEEYKRELEKYAELPRLEEEIGRLERLELDKKEVEKRLTELDDLCERWGDLEEQLHRTEGVEQGVELLSKVEKQVEAWRGIREQYEQLKGMYKDAIALERKLKRIKKITVITEQFGVIERAYQAWAEIKEGSKRLLDLERKGREISQRIKVCGREVNRLNKEFQALCPDTCPLCGAPMRAKRH